MVTRRPLADLLKEGNRNGLTKPKRIRGNGVKMIGMGEIFSHSRILDIDMERVPVTDKELQNYSLLPNDLLFARQSLVWDGAGKCSVVVKVDEPTVFESHLIRVRIDESKANPLFVYYFFNSNIGHRYVLTVVEQVAAAGLRSSDLVKLEIPCPDIIVQNKCVCLLEKLDKKIDTNNEINKNLEEQAQTIFKSWFIDFEPFGGEMPTDWRRGIANEILEFHDAKRVPLSGSEREKLDKIYPYYGATSLMDYVDNYIFEGIYLLLGEDGTVITKDGFPVLQYVDGKFWVNNHAHILTGKLGFSVEELYLLFSLTNIKSIVTGAVQPKVSQTNLKKISVVIPPIDLLKEFDGIIQPMFENIRIRRAENERLTAIRDALLPRLMSGEIDVSKIDI